MLDSIFFYGVVAALILLAVSSPAFLTRHRRITAKLMRSATLMESRVYRAVAKKYRATPNLVAESLAPEREAVVAAMTLCDRCGSLDQCDHFFGQPESDIDEARKFCPNAGRFIELAQKQRRELAQKQRRELAQKLRRDAIC